MSLARFAYATGAEGRIYELERGVIVVVDVPGVPHERIARFIFDELAIYSRANPGQINLVSGGTGGVLRTWKLQTERHPDLMVYLNPPPTEAEQAWDEWTPDIVVEVVSPSSRQRDYTTKADDYLAAGVRQYWLIDPQARSATLHLRRGDMWRKERLTARGTIRTALLPGFVLPLRQVFAAGGSRA